VQGLRERARLILKIFYKPFVLMIRVMRRLTTRIRSEKCVVRRFRRYANVIDFNDVSNQQDATTFAFINLFNSALHVSGEKFAHPQEHFLTVYTVKKCS